MKIYKIAVRGNDDAVHQKALRAAVEVVVDVTGEPVYRAWVEPLAETHDIVRAHEGQKS